MSNKLEAQTGAFSYVTSILLTLTSDYDGRFYHIFFYVFLRDKGR